MGELALPSPNEPLDTEFSVRRKTVLLLGDTATLRDEVLPLLGELDLDVRHLPDPHTAAQMANDDVDLYLLDLSSVTGEVSLICDQLINRKPDRPAPVLVLAGEKETELLLEALRTGAEDYISKPVETHEVLVRIRSALCVKAWQEHARESRERVAIVARIVFGTNTGLELDEVVSPVLPQISRLAKGDLAFVIVVDHDGNETDRIFPTIKNHKPDLGLIEPLIREAVRTKQPQYAVSLPKPEPVRANTGGQTYRSGLLVPLVDRDQVFGLLGVVRIEAIPFVQRDIDSLAVVGDTLAISTSRARWLQEIARSHLVARREMEMLGRLQKLLLPQSLPEYEGLRFRAFYQPAQAAGGDYYDVIQLTKDEIAIVIADVSGHGAPAAMNMGIARSILHTVSLSQQTSPPQTIYLLNKLLCRLLGENAHITMFYVVLHLKDWTLRWTSAGHGPGMIYRAAQSKVELISENSDGSPLGWWNDAEFEEQRSSLDPGDLVFLFTDGLVEAIDSQDRQLTMKRVQDVLSKMENPTPDEVLEKVLRVFRNHVGDTVLEDDLTLLAFQRT